MNKILMILTSHRLDCFRLCMDMLIHGGSIHRFDRVVLLLNGVKGRHLRYVQKLALLHISQPPRLKRKSDAGFCLEKKKNKKTKTRLGS